MHQATGPEWTLILGDPKWHRGPAAQRGLVEFRWSVTSSTGPAHGGSVGSPLLCSRQRSGCRIGVCTPSRCRTPTVETDLAHSHGGGLSSRPGSCEHHVPWATTVIAPGMNTRPRLSNLSLSFSSSTDAGGRSSVSAARCGASGTRAERTKPVFRRAVENLRPDPLPFPLADDSS